MRAVLDTNVIVSALIWGGTPFALFDAATDGELRLFTSSLLIEELRIVLTRRHLAARLEQQRSSVKEALKFYTAFAASVVPANIERVIPDDPDDDVVVATAIAANADLIISGDRHLLSLGSYKAMRILKPADALIVIEG